jgi:hypothetical protein
MAEYNSDKYTAQGEKGKAGSHCSGYPSEPETAEGEAIELTLQTGY